MGNSEENIALADINKKSLPIFTETKSYTDWVYDLINPYLKGMILELGSGNGLISSIFISHEIPIYLSDPSKSNLEALRIRFKDSTAVKAISYIDYIKPDFYQCYSKLEAGLDTIIALNFYAQDLLHQHAIEKARFLLRKRGHLIFLLPAYTTLYDPTEQNVDDLKKYNSSALRRLLSDNFKILKYRYFNYISLNPSENSKEIGLSVLAIVRKL